MDWYLEVKNCYKRLKDEYLQHGKLIFCVDFDDTLYDFHGTGKTFNNIIELLHRWESRSEVIILTGNGESEYPKIQAYLNEHNIKYEGINCDSSVPVKGRKTYANVYIDDRGGLPLVYDMLCELIDEIEAEEHIKEIEPIKNDCVQWIRDWFEENGKGCNAIVGISGGKDSSVVAALCVEALGKERVFGVLMPNGKQSDIDVSYNLCNHLGINYCTIDISRMFDNAITQIDDCCDRLSEQTIINLPPRLRMAVLYGVSQSMNGRVANTCNLSEDWVGYSTRYGDMAGDFSPLSNLTVQEVKTLGYSLGLPKEFIEKTPADGLSGKTDEDNLGFTYKVLDKYIREGICDDPEVKERIDELHKKNLFKLLPMPKFRYRK